VKCLLVWNEPDLGSRNWNVLSCCYRVSAEGLHPTTDKVKVIEEAPTPQDVTQLKAFLGLVNITDDFFIRLVNSYWVIKIKNLLL